MDKDVTDKVEFDLPDGECLPVNQCACGQKYPPWDFTFGMERDYPKCCPTCGRWFYFTVSIKVFEVENK